MGRPCGWNLAQFLDEVARSPGSQCPLCRCLWSFYKHREARTNRRQCRVTQVFQPCRGKICGRKGERDELRESVGGVCAGAGEGGFLKMQEGFGEQVVNPGSRAEAEPQEGRTVSASLLNFGPRAVLPPCGHRGTWQTSPGP